VAAREAAAQTGTGGATGTTTFTADDFRIVLQQTPGAAYQAFELQRLFNVANCQCGVPTYIFVTFSTSGFQKRSALPEGSIEFWAGLTCDDNTTGLRATRCHQLALDADGGSGSTMPLSAFAKNGGVVLSSNVQDLSQYFGQPQTSGGGGGSTGTSGTVGPSGAAACQTGSVFTQNLWALVTFSGSTRYDVVATLGLNIDLSPPPTPTATSTATATLPLVSPGNEALIANWVSISSATTPDILGYQLLCDRAGDLQVFKNGTFRPGFSSCASDPPPGLNGHLLALDPNFICSPLLAATSTSYRLKILENGITYGVGLVAIDSHYNASPVLFDWGKPEKTLNFYDVYRNGDSSNNMPNGPGPDPGRASGGYCSIGSVGSVGAGALGGVAAATLLLGAAGLVAARRRGRRGR
jgi:hypothetical protein